MRKLTAVLVFVFIISSVFGVWAESAGTDYSWLDDMTINQLKELDVEIHKRIPYETQGTVSESFSLPGTWYMNVFGIDCYMVLHEDGTCVLVTSNGNICRGTNALSGMTVVVSSEYFHMLTGTWEISGDTLVNSMIQVSATKTDKPVRYTSSMGGSSMIDTVNEGDTLLAEYREPSELKRFDMVIVNYPERGNTLFTKRIVGLPGDTVELRDGMLFVNGVRYDEPYVNDEYRSGPLNTVSARVVPDGMYFVMGDHRNNSNDSRSIGPLSADMVLGVVVEINGVPYSVPD